MIGKYDKKASIRLMKAIKGGDLADSLEALMSGADPNFYDESERGNMTPLGCSVTYRSMECLNALLEAGADINGVDDYGLTPLLNAVMREDTEMTRVLLRKGADVSVTVGDSMVSTSEIMPSVGNTALMIAATKNPLLIKALIDGGADLDARKSDGWTAAGMAAFNGRDECLLALIEGGALVMGGAIHGMTVLQMAVISGCQKSVKRMSRENGFENEANKRTFKGDTALMLAAERGMGEAVRVLVESGADVELRDNRGMDAVGKAESNGHIDIGSWLKGFLKARTEEEKLKEIAIETETEVRRSRRKI